MKSAITEHCFLKSPIGWLRIEADSYGVTRIEFLENPPLSAPMIRSPFLKETYNQLAEYFRGDRISFKLTLNLKGTDFQQQVWSALGNIPFGTTASYKDIAEKIGCPKGARAVGMANNKNPLPIVVPCHRVIGVSGDLTGYAGGMEIKTDLLRHERVNNSNL
jgi:methylated-DNA-[protein]-cysteine S-methyltransferase